MDKWTYMPQKELGQAVISALQINICKYLGIKLYSLLYLQRGKCDRKKYLSDQVTALRRQDFFNAFLENCTEGRKGCH